MGKPCPRLWETAGADDCRTVVIAGDRLVRPPPLHLVPLKGSSSRICG